MPIVAGVGNLTVENILEDVSYVLFEPVVNTTITAFTVPAGYGDGGFGDGGYGDGTGLVVTVGSLASMYVGAQIIVGLGLVTEEVVTILEVEAGDFIAAFNFAHNPGEIIVGATFPVRQTTDPLFEQSEMLAYLSTALNDFLTDVPLVYNVSNLTVAPTAQTAALPSDCQFPVRIAYNSYPLRETSQSNMDAMVPVWTQQGLSEPYVYFRDKTGLQKFGIWPRAGNTTTVECVYAQRSAQLMGLADGFLIPDPFLLAVKFRTLSFAFSKSGEGQNPGLAKFFQGRYETSVKIATVFLAAVQDPNLQMAS